MLQKTKVWGCLLRVPAWRMSCTYPVLARHNGGDDPLLHTRSYLVGTYASTTVRLPSSSQGESTEGEEAGERVGVPQWPILSHKPLRKCVGFNMGKRPRPKLNAARSFSSSMFGSHWPRIAVSVTAWKEREE